MRNVHNFPPVIQSIADEKSSHILSSGKYTK